MKILTNPLQKELMWRVTENKRLEYLPAGVSLMTKALNLSFAPYIYEFKTFGVSNLDLLRKEPINEAFKILYGRVGRDFARESYGAMKKDYGPIYDIKRRRRRRFVNVPGDMGDAWVQYLRNFASTVAAKRITGIMNTTRKFIQSTIEKATLEGLGIQETATLLVKDWKGTTKYRAKVIARTEIISASNGGSFLGAQSTGLDLEKEWLSTKDSRTRDTHRYLDGERKPMSEDFSNGLAYPGDPEGSASETVMCRCAIVYHVLE